MFPSSIDPDHVDMNGPGDDDPWGHPLQPFSLYTFLTLFTHSDSTLFTHYPTPSPRHTEKRGNH